MTIRGRVVYNNFEGGFWGIQGDDGRKYLPVNDLPSSVRREGMRIQARVEPSGGVSFRMWGQAVRVMDVQPVDLTPDD